MRKYIPLLGNELMTLALVCGESTNTTPKMNFIRNEFINFVALHTVGRVQLFAPHWQARLREISAVIFHYFGQEDWNN